MLLHFIFFLFTFPLTIAVTGATTSNNAKPGCTTQCGNITVPYPFGIGTKCSLDDSFDLFCNTSAEPPVLFLSGDSKLRIYNISDSELRIFTKVSYICTSQMGKEVFAQIHDALTANSHRVFTFSERNKVTVIGCDNYALIRGLNSKDDFFSACLVLCGNATNVTSGQCSGHGCCQTPMPKGLNNYSIQVQFAGINIIKYYDLFLNSCAYSFIAEDGAYEFDGNNDLSINYSHIVNRIESTIPVVVDWVISPNQTCLAEVNTCNGNSSCYDVKGGGYRCRCDKGYEGNPYLLPGCHDIDECRDLKTHHCYGICINTVGSYNCTCPQGSFGNANIPDGCIVVPVAKDSKHVPTVLIIVLSLCMGVLCVLGIFVLHKLIKKTKEERQRKRFFTRNGGLLLKQQQEADPSLVDKTILYTSRELNKATDNFNVNRILGQGGHGTVYKGMLVDGRIVAVKTSKVVDESELEEFINEVVILSQVNHRNVVKLLGCCLETDVPMLVSEFIPNGTLYDLLHNETGEFPISLNMRLQIATEVAGSLSYLHSASSIPIYHRDIKTSNILLDDKYRAKVSDFGTSRFVSIDKTHLTTIVKGTFGYLDPEYFQSSQFTEKSDVYSFGVVLIELLTREKPISLTRFGENRSLATHFMLAVEEGRVMSVFDALVVEEGTRDELLALANLSIRCLNINGKNRPTMNEVAIELETIRASHMPSRVKTNIRPIIYGKRLSLSDGESSSTSLSFTDNISQ